MKPSPHRQAWAKVALNIADRTLEFMGKETERPSTQDEMLPEYDFTGKKGVRGKHYQAYQRGYQVIIHKTDGTTEIRDFALPEGSVVLAPDVRAYFSDSESVNRALRALIAIAPKSAEQAA